MKIIADFFTAPLKSVLNDKRCSSALRRTISSRPGSYIGTLPELSMSIFFSSISTQINVVTTFGETGSRNQADISGTYDRQVHV